MSAYNLGQLFGVLILVLIGFGIYRDVIKKKNKRGDE